MSLKETIKKGFSHKYYQECQEQGSKHMNKIINTIELISIAELIKEVGLFSVLFGILTIYPAIKTADIPLLFPLSLLCLGFILYTGSKIYVRFKHENRRNSFM